MNDTSGHPSSQSENFQAAQLPLVEYQPTEDERNFAMLAHLLQIFGGFIAPLVIYLVKRNSRFVAFHAMQALLWQIAYFLIVMLGVVAMFTTMFGTILHHSSSGAQNNAPPVAFFVGFGSLWLFMMLGGLLNVILAIVYCIKAHAGKWTAYPIVGRLARKIVNA